MLGAGQTNEVQLNPETGVNIYNNPRLLIETYY